MIEVVKVPMVAESGETVVVGVPAGPLPNEERTNTLAKAFELVTPSRHGAKDWKEPISAIVSTTELKERGVTVGDVREAVEFFTATSASVEYIHRGTAHAIHVTAIGYRRGPAGP